MHSITTQENVMSPLSPRQFVNVATGEELTYNEQLEDKFAKHNNIGQEVILKIVMRKNCDDLSKMEKGILGEFVQHSITQGDAGCRQQYVR